MQRIIDQQYLSESSLESLIDLVPTERFKLISTDTYDESAIYKKIESSGEIEKMMISAIQTSLIGTGSRVYGSFIFDGVEVPVSQFYKDKGVKIMLEKNSNLAPDDLTVRRLQRFFRVHIHKYLEQNKDATSYLYRKYSTNDPTYRSICFPGAEHFVKSFDQLQYLYNTYKRLDLKLGLDITERIYRVAVARAIIKPDQLKELEAGYNAAFN